MKRTFLLVACLIASYGAQAQFVSSRSETDIVVDNVKGDNDNYTRVFLGYTPTFLKFSGLDSETAHGGAIGFTYGINLTKGNSPLYLEVGLTDNLNFSKEDEVLMALNVPINITYRFKIGDSNVRIAPYVGIRPKVNVLLLDSDGDSYFNKDYYPEGPNRFQFGGQAGVNFDFNRFYLGIGYNFDFNPIWKTYYGKQKTSGVNVNIGVTF
ncbi:MAG: outer membrane beta-barrel protein [Alloprevotella sp.]|nr:outer membrane beta-barrel protein [Alloprevotella sp.]